MSLDVAESASENSTSFSSSINEEALSFSNKLNSHSLKTAWNVVAELLRADKNQNILVVNAGQGYLVKTLLDAGFENILGIDMLRDAVDRFQQAFPDQSTKLAVQNYFRMNPESLMKYDTFIFSKTLEYVENDLAFVERIPAGKRIIITSPSYDDGLVNRFYTKADQMYARYDNILDLTEIMHLNLFRNSEFLIDQNIFIMNGVRRG